MGQLPGVRPMGRCSAPASPAASTGAQRWEGTVTQAGPGGEPALQMETTRRPSTPWVEALPLPQVCLARP